MRTECRAVARSYTGGRVGRRVAGGRCRPQTRRPRSRARYRRHAAAADAAPTREP